MPGDHYVAQTYLRNFGINGQEGLVNAVRKSNMQRLDAIPVESICRKPNWSNNEYFPENPRVVEGFLGRFETEWANCVRKLSEDTCDRTTKYLMSGYLAYLRLCTPTAVRLGSSQLSSIVEDSYNKLEEKEFAKPDSEHRDAIKLIRQHGGIKSHINPNYPKAIGIKTLISLQKVLTTSPWIVFKNKSSVQFLTSDNPVCLQYHSTGLADFYCPLTPKLAIVIHPIRDKDSHEGDYVGSLKPEGVEKMNQLLVQSAEDMIIFNEFPKIEELVKEYQDWRVEQKTYNIPVEKGNLIIFQQRPVKYSACAFEGK